MSDNNQTPELGGNGKTQDEQFECEMTISVIEPPVLGVIKHEHRNADERKDSIELGPAHARLKVYFDASKPDERHRAIADGMQMIQDAVKALTDAGLLRGAGK